MRMRVAGENQDGSKWPIERHGTRRGRFESRQPPPPPPPAPQSLHTQDNARKHQKVQTIQNLPPSKKDTTSLKHAESVRITIVTRHPTDHLLGRQSMTMENK